MRKTRATLLESAVERPSAGPRGTDQLSTMAGERDAYEGGRVGFLTFQIQNISLATWLPREVSYNATSTVRPDTAICLLALIFASDLPSYTP